MAKAVTLKNSNNEELYPVTDISLANGSIATSQISDGAITTDKIANNAVTATKIDDSVLTYEKYFEYVQDGGYTGTVNVDVPIDFSVYQEIKIEMFSEPRSGSQAWNSASALASDKTTVHNAEQRGIEISSSSTVNSIYRIYPQVIAWGVSGGYSGHCSITIKHSNDINWPIYEATGYGSNAGQWLQGRINTSPPNIAYIRIPLSSPNAGGWVRAYGVR